MHDVAHSGSRMVLETARQADVTGCVARPRFDPHAVVEGKVRCDQLCLATLQHRQQAVLIIRIGGILVLT
jgi:hypothetical protein